MPLGNLAAGLLACAVLLGGCRSKEQTAPEPTPKEPAASAAPVVRARIHAELPEFSFTLVGDKAADGATLSVKKIEIRRGVEPVQVIDGLKTATPLQAATAPLEAIDMNFDGYQDIRIVEFLPAGPNVPYLNWLFDPGTGRFVGSRALNEIPAPQYDDAKREIHSHWRDGATRYGSDTYVYQKGEPVLARKETREYSAPGVYKLQVSRLINGAWKGVEQREVREK